MSLGWVIDQDPKRLAVSVVEASRGHPGWLETFAGELETQALAGQLRGVLRVWGLSLAEAARCFGVSRQAVSKWSANGVPAERLEAVADLAAATEVLLAHLKPDRIPAAVRRRADRLGGRSLVDLLAEGDHRGVLAACRAMFDVTAVHA